jgi:hypothetical protein
MVIIGVLGLVLAYLHVYFRGTRGSGTPAAATNPTTAPVGQTGV